MDSRFADLLEANVEKLRKLVGDLPGVRVLPVASVQAIKDQVTLALKAGDVYEANRIFWTDQVQTLDVWRSIFLWRISEQIEATLHLKSSRQLVAAAAVCRSAMELAVSGLHTSGKLFEVLKKLKTEDVRTGFPPASKSFPSDVERAIFGTRIEEFIIEDNLPKQTNLLTQLDRLQRHNLGGEISKYYETLCDMTHPNLGGNRPFFRAGDGSTIVRVSQEYDPDWSEFAESTINSTLSWTAHAARNVFVQSGEGIDYVRNKLFES